MLRRAAMEVFRGVRAEGMSKKDSYREAIDYVRSYKPYLRSKLKKLKRLQGANLTIKECIAIENHARTAMQLAVDALRKHWVLMSINEAAKVVDAYNYLLHHVPPESRSKFSYNTFLKYFYAARKKKGKPLNSNDVRKIVAKMGKHDEFLIAWLMADRSGIRAPRSAGLLGPRSHDLFARAKKELRLDDVSMQRQMLTGELNRRLGEDSLPGEGRTSPRKEVKRMVRAMAHDEFPDSLKRSTRESIRNWDSLPQEKKNEVLRGRSKMELAKHLVSLFEINRSVVERKESGWESSQWVLDALRRPENRLFLAELAMKWYGPKPKKK